MTDTSRQVILVCEECEERTVLEGPLSVWGLRVASSDASAESFSPPPTATPEHLPGTFTFLWLPLVEGVGEQIREPESVHRRGYGCKDRCR